MQRPLGQEKNGVGHFALLVPERQKEFSSKIVMTLKLYRSCEAKRFYS